ncbi:MAG: hypothetical protein K8R87_08765, partial [Verrucomicrobia bacterium]|nr:hypothetical protein [Verrucomicrobiota bacterium]
AHAQEKSPRGGMLVVEECLDDGGKYNFDTRHIWLVSAKDTVKRELLFTHYRSADVLFSDDETWLVINDHRLSNEACMLLYRRIEGLRYEQAKDVSGDAWAYFCVQNGVRGELGFDHTYVDALMWLKEKPHTILLTLRGHADSRNHVHDWQCYYDVDTGKFSQDDKIKSHNRNRAVLEK